ncbi:MAG: carbon-nitrogen hydrolase family protein [Candidatus Pacearchaeota archaeon]
MKDKKPIIAVAQIKYFDLSKKNNVEKIKKYIRLAKEAGADIVCFPESCVHKTKVLDLKHPFIVSIKEECKKHSIWCVISEDIMIKNKTYNLAILIDRCGKIKGFYKKINLYGDKTSAGKRIRVFKTDFAKIGLALCWDLAFPELFKKMKQAGAEIIFCPSQWWYETKAHDQEHKEREIKLLESLIMARAFENICYVALCNPVMDSKFQVSYSAIADPHRILSKIVHKEGIITAEINLKTLKKLHKIYR